MFDLTAGMSVVVVTNMYVPVVSQGETGVIVDIDDEGDCLVRVGNEELLFRADQIRPE